MLARVNEVDGMSDGDGEVTLKLSRQESLVLFEWLAQAEDLELLTFRHPSEQKVLWKLQGELESLLVEPFAPDYARLLAEARMNVEAGDP